jgi:DNA-binding CsgD family transcriptional regulator
MATANANVGRVFPTQDAGRTLEELVRLLLHRAVPAEADVSALPPEGGPQECEQIILEIELEDARYLLVRMPKAKFPRVQLSPREQEIVRMVAQGHPNKVIAEVLNISSWTVCTYLRRIFAKLGVGSRAAMVARLLETTRGVRETRPSAPRVPARVAYRHTATTL